jgi:hypothetical protein
MMKAEFWLDQIPLWGIFLIVVVVAFFSIWIGTLIGRRRRRLPNHETEASLGTSIGAALGLLAFLLTFTFGMAGQHLQIRKQLLLDEVNTIGTTYLRAGMLPQPHKSQIRKLLSEYVDIRVVLAKENAPSQRQKFQEFIHHADMLQDKMWSHALALAKVDNRSIINALFIDSLNKMIDLQNSRLTLAGYRIPTVIWNVLYFITILSMLTVGYQAGLSGKSISKVGFLLALIFATVILLIVDLDRIAEGSIRVNQQPMLDLQKKMQVQDAVS